jgi:hypothetical protein
MTSSSIRWSIRRTSPRRSAIGRARRRVGDRLEGRDDAAFVEGRDDGVAGAHVFAAHRIAGGIRAKHFQ